MPGMNGDETTLRIHANIAIVKQPKIIMVTAYGREDVMRLAELAGVNGFLIKPVSPSALLDTILSVLGRGRVFNNKDKKALAVSGLSRRDFSGKRLLLVEDNDINREFAIELLRSINIDVDEAPNGEEAVAMVQRQHYDGVLMDIQMPVMDGLKATRCIRDLALYPGGERYAGLPIIAMTALAMASDVEKSQAAGMNDHVSKPIDPEYLFGVLAKWLPQAPLTDGADRDADISEYPPELLALQSLQAVEGIRRIGGKADAYRKQLKRFREHYANAVIELQDLLTEWNFVSAENYCHALKGVTGNIGAHQLYECVARIDTILKQGRQPSATEFEQLRTLLQHVLTDIDSLAPPPLPSIVGEPLSREQVLSVIARLMAVLESDLGAAETVLNELRAGVAETGLEAAINEIAADIDVFNIDRALSLLAALQQSLATA